MSKTLLLHLRGLNLDSINQKYNINHFQSIKTNDNTTRIEDIFSQNQLKNISFIDEAHAMRVFDISTITPNSGTTYNCFWDHHTIQSYPVFCPISYQGSKVEKSYVSHGSKYIYKIREDVMDDYKIDSKLGNMFTKIQNNKYTTDGAFCSFNCCQAFINDNASNPLYNLSSCLLLKIYNDLFSGNPISKIEPAPHFRKLAKYGGNYSIQEFRSSFNCVDWKYYGQIHSQSLCHLYEEKLRI